jgi:hypothetical protein
MKKRVKKKLAKKIAREQEEQQKQEELDKLKRELDELDSWLKSVGYE